MWSWVPLVLRTNWVHVVSTHTHTHTHTHTLRPGAETIDYRRLFVDRCLQVNTLKLFHAAEPLSRTHPRVCGEPSVLSHTSRLKTGLAGSLFAK